nr:hypothetical protein [Agrobacterium deltaense]
MVDFRIKPGLLRRDDFLEPLRDARPNVVSMALTEKTKVTDGPCAEGLRINPPSLNIGVLEMANQFANRRFSRPGIIGKAVA